MTDHPHANSGARCRPRVGRRLALMEFLKVPLTARALNACAAEMECAADPGGMPWDERQLDLPSYKHQGVVLEPALGVAEPIRTYSAA